MGDKFRNSIVLSLIPQFLIVKWLSGYPDIVEHYYSTTFYPFISNFFRILLGWIPFSVGEFLYTVLVLLAINYIVKKWQRIRQKPLLFLRNAMLVFSVFYFTFHLVWGFNYYREPLAKKLKIQDKANFEEVLALTEQLVEKTNALHYTIAADSVNAIKIPYTTEEVFKITGQGYASLKSQLPFLSYNNPSIKNSMFSLVSSYMGIGGYLNPFTNEAQVNDLTPMFRVPVISGHEIGHQLGYSAENETNFIGYIATLENNNIYFQYAAAAYGLNHCLNALYGSDMDAYERLYAQLNEGTKKNYQELRDFNEAYKNPFEPIFKSIFNAFLKANNQPDGIRSYSMVVHLMVGYHEKYPIL